MTGETPPSCFSVGLPPPSAVANPAASMTIRPRRFGLGLLAITVAMLLAAINYGNNLIFLLAFVVIALMVNSAWQGWRSLKNLRVIGAHVPMRPAFEAGQLLVDFDSRLDLPAVDLTCLNPPSIGLIDTEAQTTTAVLTPGQTSRATCPLAPAPRGYLPLPEILLSTHYPLGLWTIRRRVSLAGGQWVHPAPVEGRQRPHEARQADAEGTLQSEGDPTRLRAYQPGDPFRHIVFRHFAKTGKLVSRTPEAKTSTVRPTVINYADFRGTREQRLSAMTASLLEHVDHGRPWQLILPGKPSIEARSEEGQRQARRRALQQLARFGRRADADGFDRIDWTAEDHP